MDRTRGSSRRPCPGLWGAVAVALLTACDSNATQLGELPNASASHDYRVVEIVDGLDHPWGLAFLPNGDILVTERSGSLRLVTNGTLRPDPVEGAPSVAVEGQGGLLDIALHPEFASNELVYLTYSKAVDGGLTTAVARAQWDGERLVGLQDVFIADAAASGGRHFGSRVLFGPDGSMYVTVGDRGLQEPAQDRSNHIGTTLRLNPDGSVPVDNPFVDDPLVRDEIFTYGNRNAQGMAIRPGTDEIWQSEHGPRGGDELNRLVAGGNYGWPEYRFGTHYDGTPIPDPEPESGIVPPVAHWTPALAPSGLTFYTGELFPNWQGDAFIAGLAGRQIRRVVLNGDNAVEEEGLLEEYGERIRAVADGPDGALYFLTDSSNGVLARLEPRD